MSKVATICLRAAQAIVTVAELGLTAYAAYEISQPSEVCYDDGFGDDFCSEYPGYSFGGVGAFLLFNSVWTILTLVVLVVLPLCIKVNMVAITVLDGLAMLLWFAGAVGFAAVAANLGPIADGMIALAFVIWALFLATFILNLLSTIHGSGSAMNQTQPSNGGYGYGNPQPAFNNYNQSQNPELAHV